ncbi:hypothetical protein FRC07_014025 [Ceratobasidium sp. 392]|nr:hypothetical protein FRC07_014025 [Ceratobasidium sp. 392]
MPERRLNRTDRQLKAAGLKECGYCLFCFKTRGFPQHAASCRAWTTARSEALASASVLDDVSAPKNALTVPQMPERYALGTASNGDPWQPLPGPTTPAAMEVDRHTEEDPVGAAQDIHVGSREQSSTPEPIYEEGSISVRVQARPGRMVQQDGTMPVIRQHTPDPEATTVPWWPFITHADFRFARVALESGISASQIDEHLSIHHLASDCPLTLHNADELRRIQSRAEHLLAPYEPVEYSVPLRATNPKDYATFTKDLQFDSVQKFRMTEGKWLRFIDEPWTADDWPGIEATLPIDGLLIAIILYADKSLASSWGTKKLYPVIAHLANLPRHICNGRGVGGGRVVALLPVVEKAPNGLGTTAFANFKCDIWHRGMEKLLDTIRMEAKTGYWVKLELHRAINLGKKMWRLFPAIPIIAADLEEQYVMGCERGTNARCPCPRCTILSELLANLSHSAEFRRSEDVLGMMDCARKLNVGQTEAMLQEQSYRPVLNALSVFDKRTNVFHALSYDTLHNDDLGRWGGHIWPMLKDFISEHCSRSVSNDFEARIAAVPSWPELNHYPSALSMGFSDGGKYKDLLRVVLHGAMALPVQALSLVELTRKQAEIRVLASLEVHTEETIALGHKLISNYHKISLVCNKKYGKSFDFPKNHQLVHLFDDISKKGVTANYSTKPSEQMHGRPRRAYGTSSKKSSTVDSEVLHTTHAFAVYELIQSEIEDWKKSQLDSADDQDGTDDGSDTEDIHISLRSRDKPTSTDLLEIKHVADPACQNLGTRIYDIIEELDPLLIQPGHSLKLI